MAKKEIKKEGIRETILFILPKKKGSNVPVIDEATRKMTAAFRQSKAGEKFRGVHQCVCGVYSSNCNYNLPDGGVTNSLSVHYLAYHRDEVGEIEMEKVLKLPYGEAEPTALELNKPQEKELSKEIKPPGGFKLR
jgi:hypothetical protein